MQLFSKIRPSESLANFDVDVGDVKLFKKIDAPEGHRVGVFIGKRFGSHPNAKRGGATGFSELRKVDDVAACPFDPHLAHASDELGNYNLPPEGVVELVAGDGPDTHGPLHVLGLQRSSAGAC